MMLLLFCMDEDPAVCKSDEEKVSIESSVEWWFKEKARENVLQHPEAVFAGSKQGGATHGV